MCTQAFSLEGEVQEVSTMMGDVRKINPYDSEAEGFQMGNLVYKTGGITGAEHKHTKS